MIKWICILFRALPSLIACWISCLHMNHHKDKYSLQQRYNRVRKTAITVRKACRCQILCNDTTMFQRSHEAQLYIANHLSIFDIVCFFEMSEKPILMISKMENKKVPFLKTICKAVDVLFIDRKDVRQSLRICKEAGTWISKGYDVLVFPEGTRSKDGNVHEFKAALSSIVHYAHSKIVPVCMYNTNRALSFYWFKYPIINLYLFVLPTIPYEQYIEHKKEINEHLQKMIQTKLIEIKESAHEHH